MEMELVQWLETGTIDPYENTFLLKGQGLTLRQGLLQGTGTESKTEAKIQRLPLLKEGKRLFKHRRQRLQ